MGEILAVSLTSHAPTIMMPREQRLELNEGREISLVPGLHRMRDEKLAALDVDTIVILDTHWFTTVEHVVTAQDHFEGVFTSAELPRGMSQIPFEYDGDPELADAIAAQGEVVGTPIHANHDPHLPIFYATINLVKYLRTDQKVISVSIAQTGEDDDFQRVGRAIGRAVAATDRKVVLLASGGMSHRFWSLKKLEEHEASDPSHIITPEARAADEQRIAWMEAGDHAAIVDHMDDYMAHAPEGGFGHVLMMQAAVGGRACIATGEKLSDYENATGTGQVHVWFDRPATGWTGHGVEVAGITTDEPATAGAGTSAGA
ncbi:catechol 1,2-dioxygenase [Salsipaludibacter albus]|uniref:DODA-type extradiol aromatic ring-opening family dioxygenase n=1 Tax=Salsipaludibacter albus TaxID=2849650 RepID=UPI001EE4CEA5|nr:catechol 1,2-dioxygenase [Salsipaludibacter albus]MBY5162963.1 catechol 1,2-dioxygenase [Salsipaludibacter albus]